MTAITVTRSEGTLRLKKRLRNPESYDKEPRLHFEKLPAELQPRVAKSATVNVSKSACSFTESFTVVFRYDRNVGESKRPIIARYRNEKFCR